MRVIFTLLAERQIAELHSYIAVNSNEDRADDYISRIVGYCESLVNFPLRGTKRDDIVAGLRITSFQRRITIAFLVQAEEVLIEGIFSGGQDFAAVFRS